MNVNAVDIWLFAGNISSARNSTDGGGTNTEVTFQPTTATNFIN